MRRSIELALVVLLLTGCEGDPKRAGAGEGEGEGEGTEGEG